LVEEGAEGGPFFVVAVDALEGDRAPAVDDEGGGVGEEGADGGEGVADLVGVDGAAFGITEEGEGDLQLGSQALGGARVFGGDGDEGSA